jgi:hypothetical protein
VAGLPCDGPSIFGAFVGLYRPNQNGLMICGLMASCCCVKPLHVPPSLVMHAVRERIQTRRSNRLDELNQALHSMTLMSYSSSHLNAAHFELLHQPQDLYHSFPPSLHLLMHVTQLQQQLHNRGISLPSPSAEGEMVV